MKYKTHAFLDCLFLLKQRSLILFSHFIISIYIDKVGDDKLTLHNARVILVQNMLTIK